MSQQANEFRQRQQRRVSSSGALPRPSPNAPAKPSPRNSATRSTSYSSMGSASSLPSVPFPSNGMHQRSTSYTQAPGGYAYSSTSNGSYSNGHSYGNGGNASSNGYSTNSSGTNQKIFEDDNKYSKRKKSMSGGMGMVVGGICLVVYALVITVLFVSKSSSTKNLLQRLGQSDTLGVIQKVEELQRKLTSSESARRRAEQDARTKASSQLSQLEREKKLLQEEVDLHKRIHLPQANSQLERHSRREIAFQNQVSWLKDAARRESKRMILERYGPGPHRVEITYRLPQDESHQRYKFVIDMAPIDLVPHAVHLFLEQVEHGLFEGTHFYLNGPHIVQAGPQPEWGHIDGTDDAFQQHYEDASQKDKISGGAIETINKYEKQVAYKKSEAHDYDDDEYAAYYNEEELLEEDRRTKNFADLGLDQLAFPDYHDQYPHVAWTVGYTGRPGGPDWYINKVDNTKGHGPGGQSQHALNEQGDSCFGSISMEGNGRELLVRNLYSAEVYADHSEWHHFISDPIEIVHAQILTKDPILDHHLHLTHLTSQHKVYNHRKKEAKLPESSQELDANQQQQPESKNIHKLIHKGQHRPHIPGGAEA